MTFIKVDMNLQTRRDVLRLLKAMQKTKETRPSYSIPKPPDFIVGFDVPLKELKTKLWEESLLILTAPGGCGKTTLVKMLCQDGDIKGIPNSWCDAQVDWILIKCVLCGCVLSFKLD